MNRDYEEQDVNIPKTPETQKGLTGWLDKKKAQGKKLRKDQLLIILLSGVLLMIVAFPVGGSGNQENDTQTDGVSLGFGEESGKNSVWNQMDEEANGNERNSDNGLESTDTYITEMETKLEQVLSNVENVGRVDVLITLQSSEEKIVEKDTPINRSNTEEQDSGGGSRSVNNVDTQETTIYETDSGKSTPYVVKTTSPRVEGVVVVCEGAGIGTVSKNITEAIEVLFGIEPHKIKVVKMKTS